MFGAERFASTRRTFLPKLFTKDDAVSSARVVFPTPPLIDTNARMFVILSPVLDNYLGYIRFWMCVEKIILLFLYFLFLFLLFFSCFCRSLSRCLFCFY